LPIGGSLGAAVIWGMVGGASSATAAQLFVNLTTPGASWDDDLVGAAITGGITGGIFGGVGYGLRQWITLSLLGRRAQQIHSALDPIAQTRRTTAVLQTDAGRIVAGGGRDLTRAQQALLGPGEIPARLPGAHAEVTALQKANQLGASPVAMATTREICPICAAVIEASGGTLTSPTTAIWFRLK
jgi:hypothetical protein